MPTDNTKKEAPVDVIPSLVEYKRYGIMLGSKDKT